MKKKRGNTGFTIVELVIVIVVLSILTTVAVPVFTSFVDGARGSAALQECKNEWTNYVCDTGLVSQNLENSTFVLKYADSNSGYSAYFLVKNGQFNITAFAGEDALNEQLNEDKQDDNFSNYTELKSYSYTNDKITIYRSTDMAEAEPQNPQADSGKSQNDKEGEADADSTSGTGQSGGGSSQVDTPIETSEEFLEFTLTEGGYEVSGLIAGSDINEVIVPPEHENLPVVSIGEKAFYKDTKITKIVILDGVVEISDMAFLGCTALSEVVLPDTLQKIGAEAFGYCPFTSITFPENLTEISDKAFYDCGLESVKIPDSVLSIGDLSFYYCQSLKEITLGSGLITTGRKAFEKCPLLESVMLSDGITSIGSGSFCDCTSLKSINIPDSVKTIGENAFYGCTAMDSVVIGKGVESIENSAFYDCTSLTEIYIYSPDMPDLTSNNYVFYLAGKYGNGITVTFGSQVKKVSDYLFYPDSSAGSNSPKITTVIFEEGSACTSIGDYAFYYNSSLADITLPDTITDIGEAAFFNCDSLTNITIPDSVETIGDNAFKNCDALNDVILGNNVKSIGEYAFNSCTSLTEIIIPQSVISIGKYAFSGSGLKSATFESAGQWYVTTNKGASSGTDLDIVSTVNYAAYLTTSSKYAKYYWYRK